MKKIFLLLFCLFGSVCSTLSQPKTVRYSKTQLQTDLAFLKQQIFNVHNYPYTELTPTQYEQLFANIGSKLKDSLTAADFLKLVKPVVAHLSDEHSDISLKTNLLPDAYQNQAVYLPFTLSRSGNDYGVNYVLDGDITPTLLITHINGVPVATWVQRCALCTSGFAQQRTQAALDKFGYLFAWASPDVSTSFTIQCLGGQTMVVKGTTLKVWTDYLARQQPTKPCDERLTYTRYGDVGYIDACSFDVKAQIEPTLQSIQKKILGIFKQIKADGITSLIIDVSKNEGGNSAVGNCLIDYIYGKPYLGYQSTFKRSDEYLKLLTSWGFTNADYAAKPVGELITYPADKYQPGDNAYRFNGKVAVVIGPATFSSAMLFATMIKDNKIAPLMGQPSQNGHPSGFGELYNTTLPNTKISLRFGVKEWIRPAGKAGENVLRPDILLTNEQMGNVDEMVKKMR